MVTETLSLQQIFSLEQVSDGRYRGYNREIGNQNVFGGQILGQALAAANFTIKGRFAHSLHAYFLLPGNKSLPIDFIVEGIRDGSSFSTRCVSAIQNNRTIFKMMVSYHQPEGGLDHQIAMPDVPSPVELPSLKELAKSTPRPNPEKFWDGEPVLPLEFRPVEPGNPYNLEKKPPYQKVWFRAIDPFPDNGALQQCALAYASDFGILNSIRYPHGISFRQKNVQLASIDHAMWFHRPCDIRQWLLFVSESPSTVNSRGFARGDIYSSEGTLVASVAQEGLMRVYPEE